MSDEAYVLMSIGPVQSYISQARRTQDLFAGSRLLSVLAGAALDELQTEFKRGDAYLVYPSATDVGIPNRLLFRCDAASADGFAKRARQAVYRRWSQIAQRTRDYLEIKAKIPADLWERQAGGADPVAKPAPWLEVQYVIAPYQEDYQKANRQLNQYLAARKLYRNFAVAPEPEPGFKCSVTGEHEALHAPRPQGEPRLTEGEVQGYWAALRASLPNRAILSDRERLCALSAIKRFVHEADPDLGIERFPSTSSIASAPFRAHILRSWMLFGPFVQDYLAALWNLMEDAFVFKRGKKPHPEHFPGLDDLIKALNVEDNTLKHFLSMDGDFLYEEAFQDAALRNYVQSDKISVAHRDETLKALRCLYKQAGQRPSDYLAILSMDGDQMGQAVENLQDEGDHHKLSGTLAGFARDTVRPAIEGTNALGRLIYAGGDDLLAMLPVGSVMDAAEALRTQFAKQLPGQHMSAGIALVHRTHNLQDAIRVAKSAEHAAKHELGRDAFLVRVLRRSGEAQEAGFRWEVDPADGNKPIKVIPDVFSPLIKAMSAPAEQKQLSRSIPYDMEQFVYAMVMPERDLNDERQRDLGYRLNSDMRTAEFKRIFEHRCGTAFKDSGEAQKLLNTLTALGNSDSDGRGWSHVAGLLRLARFLAQGGGADVAAI